MKKKVYMPCFAWNLPISHDSGRIPFKNKKIIQKPIWTHNNCNSYLHFDFFVADWESMNKYSRFLCSGKRFKKCQTKLSNPSWRIHRFDSIELFNASGRWREKDLRRDCSTHLSCRKVLQSWIKSSERYKFVFLGDAGTGKTSIITRFIYDSFDPTYQVPLMCSCNVVHDRNRFSVQNTPL